ncbi:transketolase [Petroclostridium sp. X23]|uniref:transketolase n=1 Tax=Petroclostridium sp. X23 TaxID=3045146 RepID=UPI0024ACD527|nr:transketolase [Petroclostridium sp. X23]WHH60827.1 transketolase [Petroclostridium sp. X23]
MLTNQKVKALNVFANEIRIEAIRAMASVGMGHVGGSMSVAEVIAVLYGEVMRYDIQKPNWMQRDKLILSKGHSGPGLYAALALKGFFPLEMITTLNAPGTMLPSHCDRNKTPGIDMSTGSLGQGLSVASGIAYGDREDGRESYTYCILGDGECQEGQIWEAAMFAAHHRQSNLIAFIDYNSKQLDGKLEDVLSLGDIAKKFEAFGWKVQDIDGHDVSAIYEAIQKAKEVQDVPNMIILRTIKGKGCSFAEKLDFNHNIPVPMDKSNEAIEMLKEQIAEIES